jgi:hypothetical protein
VNPEPVEVTWTDDWIEVVWATEAEWLETRQSRRDYEAGR